MDQPQLTLGRSGGGKLQEMLTVCGGSFERAEQTCLNYIAQGNVQEYLDLALLFHARGNVAGAKQALEAYAKICPDCPVLRFSCSWFKLYDGDLQDGLDHIEAGRVLGTNPVETKLLHAPQWDGEADLHGKTILLQADGGAGDQIMCVRAVEWMRNLGAKVLVSCNPALVGLFSRLPHIAAVMGWEGSPHVKYDFYAPMQSTFRLCKRTWETLWTGQYMPRLPDVLWDRIIPKSDHPNIGIRWRGLPTFEHEQLRIFPPELLWKAIAGVKANFYSLQKDDLTLPPEHVTNLDPLLGNWEQTAHAIARLDLVITSDTSIGHLAAAMNIPTWIVIPVMCYWPWARPGDKSAWYPSVRLFRQITFGDWRKPFDDVRQQLLKVNVIVKARENILREMA